MHWKATVIVRLFLYMSFIWSVNNNNLFSLKYVELCAWKSVFAGILLHYLNIKKTAAESHRILVEVLAWMTKNVLGSQKCLKMKNWKHYSMKIVAKHKNSLQNLWESLKEPFQNVQRQPDTFKSKEIGFHINSSRETLKGGFACPKFCWNATKRSHFCIGLLLVMKNGSITTTSSAKNHMWNPANKPNQRQSRISMARR